MPSLHQLNLSVLWMDGWNIPHFTSSPGYSRSNGKAESAVKIAKTLMKKVQMDKSDPYIALLELRSTPIQTLNSSPAQILFGRRTRTLLPTSSNHLKSHSPDIPHAAIQKRMYIQKKHHGKSANSLKPLHIGETVYFDKFGSQFSSPDWKKGYVTHINDPRSYVIEGPGKAIYRRNRVHVRPAFIDAPEPPNVLPASPRKSASVTSPQSSDVLPASQSSPRKSASVTSPQSLVVLPESQSSPRRSTRQRRPPTYLQDYST
ncbi:Uncharacterised protein r2_g3321 [Pycnogonum litorale]